ncbi:uncharacterized protein QC761_0024360 [Podospora bellae-mahoneyi]|uniref:Uncharacterized protein n=1 Tax=Podospora bellae-mahoneyi TaxID=2093777 RepID=A0ABR0G1Z2_9PEZI|nr:hypothetical protein QC761_0024360 [Podospora bellae-mahoneyi]
MVAQVKVASIAFINFGGGPVSHQPTIEGKRTESGKPSTDYRFLGTLIDILPRSSFSILTPPLAGSSIVSILAGASACAKLELADEIVATLGNDPQVIAGAAALVAAEKNFNPFAVDIPTICSNAALPATPELRGIIPLVDPAVKGADVQNANSAAS